MVKEKKNGLRKSKYDRKDLAPKIMEMMINELCTALHACKHFGVNHQTFYWWVTADEELAEMYARARETLGHLRFEEIIEISNEIVPMTERGLDRAAVSDKQVRIAARQFASRYLAPRTYGERVRVDNNVKQDVQGETLDILKILADKLPT